MMGVSENGFLCKIGERHFFHGGNDDEPLNLTMTFAWLGVISGNMTRKPGCKRV